MEKENEGRISAGIERYLALEAMNRLMMALNNEDAYYQHWIHIVPDQATADDLAYIAGDEQLFREAASCYLRCVRKYGRDGLAIGSALYGGGVPDDE